MKKVFLILVLTVLFLVPIKANAGDLKLTYDNDLKKCADINYFVFPSFNNNGVLDGNLFFYSYLNENESRSDLGIIKLGLNNKIVFDKHSEQYAIDDVEITEVDESGYSGILIKKYASSNNVLFKYYYHGNGSEEIFSSFKSFDDNGNHDGYIITLFTTSTDLGIEPGFVMIKFDLNGKLLWQRNISDFFSLFELIYVVDGRIDSLLTYDTTEFYRNDYETGEELWAVDVGFDVFAARYSYNSSNEIDGVILIGYDGDIAKYDLNGNKVFNKNIGENYRFFDVISSRLPYGTYDGYFVTAVQDSTKMFLLKFDFSGNLIWKEEYKNDVTTAFRIYENYDDSGKFNGYLLHRIVMNVGSNSNDNNGCDNKYFLVKYTYENYLIVKDEDDKGSITTSNDKAYPGEIVKVSVSPKEGYTLKRIVVTGEDGKEIEVSKDGTFVMPDGKVTVTAVYNRITNPKTVSACYVVLGIILLVSIGTLIVQKKKEII